MGDDVYYDLKAFAELAWAELRAIGPDGVFAYGLLEEMADKLGMDYPRRSDVEGEVAR